MSALNGFGPELRALEKQGFVRRDAQAPSGYRVRPLSFVWWLADELVRTGRDQPTWEGLVTFEEKADVLADLELVITALQASPYTGAEGLIDAMVKGLSRSDWANQG